MNEPENALRECMAQCSQRLDWLTSVAGEPSRRKFMGAKIDVPQYSGLYVDGILPTVEGYRFLIELLDQLKDGLAIPLFDVDSYYAHGKRWPAGMRLEGDQRVDVWPEPQS